MSRPRLTTSGSENESRAPSPRLSHLNAPASSSHGLGGYISHNTGPNDSLHSQQLGSGDFRAPLSNRYRAVIIENSLRKVDWSALGQAAFDEPFLPDFLPFNPQQESLPCASGLANGSVEVSPVPEESGPIDNDLPEADPISMWTTRKGKGKAQGDVVSKVISSLANTTDCFN